MSEVSKNKTEVKVEKKAETKEGKEMKKESKEMKKESKNGSAAVIVMVVISIAISIATMVMVIMHTNKSDKFMKNMNKVMADDMSSGDGYIEDGYKVGDQYEIKSTKDISDAYISGDTSNLSEDRKALYDQAVEILESETKGKKTNYEKEKAIYEWIYKNIRVGSSTSVSLAIGGGDTYTPEGVLSGKQAVCVGFATTFRMFMNMLGMDCHIVHNDYHSWDLVQLDDGEWYHVDLYTDISSGPEYKCFNLTDDTMKTNNEWSASSLPAAVGTEYTYANQNAEDCSDIYDIPAKALAFMKAGKGAGYFRFKSEPDNDTISASDTMVNNLTSALSMVGSNGDSIGKFTASQLMEMSVSGEWIKGSDGSYIFGLYVYSYSGSSDTTSDEVTDKMNSAISDAFGVDVTGSGESYSCDEEYEGDPGLYGVEGYGSGEGEADNVEAE